MNVYSFNVIASSVENESIYNDFLDFNATDKIDAYEQLIEKYDDKGDVEIDRIFISVNNGEYIEFGSLDALKLDSRIA